MPPVGAFLVFWRCMLSRQSFEITGDGCHTTTIFNIPDFSNIFSCRYKPSNYLTNSSLLKLVMVLILHSDILALYFLMLCDLDLIFKVTAVEKLKIHSGGDIGLSENTVTS